VRSIDTVLNPQYSSTTTESERRGSVASRRRSSQGSTTMLAADSLFDMPDAVDGDRERPTMTMPTCAEACLTSDEEQLGLGSVDWSVYWAYVQSAGGLCAVSVVLFSFLANVGTTVFTSVWLSEWLDRGHEVRARDQLL